MPRTDYQSNRNSYNRDDNRGDRDNRGGGRGRDDNRGGGYRGGGHGRDDNRGGGYRGGGRGRDDNRGGGYRGGGRGRDDNRGGGYRGGGRGRDDNRSHYKPPEYLKTQIKLEDSSFTIPTHDLTLEFQRAIGMTEGTIIEVDERKPRGMVQVGDYFYKFEDNRPAKFQKRYPLNRMVDKVIKFNFWPTYSQKAAKFRKIDEPPTLKISNLRKELPHQNLVEVIGQVLMVDADIFIVAIFSQTQRKRYLVTIMGQFTGEPKEHIHMLGTLEEGAIHYKSHKVLYQGK